MDSFTIDPAPDAIRAGDGQRALWTAWRLAPDDPGYNMSYAAELDPGTDPRLLADAFAHVVAGHEALSSRYAETADGTLVMRRVAGFIPDIGIVETAAMADSERNRWLAAEADRPLPLDTGTSCRIRLLADGAEPDRRLHLVIVLHHIAGDFLSFERLCDQVFLAYERRRAGEAPAPVPTGRYAQWLERARVALTGAEGDRLERFWRDTITDQTAPELPTGRAAAQGMPAGTPAGAVAERDIPLGPATTARLRALAGRLGAGPFPVLTAAYQLFLHRWSGQDRFVVGTPVSGRQGAGDRDLIGYTLNALPWPADLSGNPSFADLARAAQRTLRAMMRHRRLPLARIAALAAAGRGADAATAGPLFHHMTTYVPVGERTALYRHVRRELFAHQRGAANALNLRWVDEGETLVCQWRQDPALFTPETVERMQADFLALLDRALDRPDAPISELKAAAAERPSLLDATGGARPDHPTALALFETAAALHPGRAAVEDGATTLSYADLDRRAARLARRLRAAGLRPGDRVGLHRTRCADLAVGMIAAWKAGAAYLCLDPTLPAARLRLLAEDSAVRVVVGLGDRPDWIGTETAHIDLGPGPDAEDGDDDGLVAASPGGRCAHLPAYLIYTSGSTGTPKSVVVTQGNLARYAAGVLDALALPEEATLAALASLTADLGYTAWFGALLGGRTLRIVGDALADDPDALARHFAERPVDALKIVPSHLAALLAVPDAARLLPRRCLVLGGEALDAGLVARLRGLSPDLRILNHYGPTETTVGCLTHDAADTAAMGEADGRIPVGRPLAGARAVVLDRHLCPVPAGVVGELAIGGDGVAAGYRGRPGLTADRFIPDPFGRPGDRLYRTGDRARLSSGGAVEFLGRADDQVKIRGFRVEPGEVESWLRRQPGVAEAAVTARPAPSGEGLRLVAFAAPATLDAAGLLTAMRAELPDAMVPSALRMLDRLPRLPNGKIDRKALPDADPATLEAPPAARALSPVEETLAALWAAALKRPSVGPDEDFFAIGGDSIVALQIIAKARPKGLALTPKAFFQKRTIAAIAAAIDAARKLAKPRPAAVPATPPFALCGLDETALEALRAERPGLEDAYPLSPLQEGLLFHSLLDPTGGAYVNQLVVDADGPFEPDAFVAAWQAAAAANPILRTTFRWEGLDRPLQLVEAAAELPVARRDWRGLDEARRTLALDAFLAEDRARGIPLDRAPLMRLALLRTGEHHWWLVWSRHHLVVDGWCSILLLDEVLERYRAALAGTVPALPVRRPFRDHIALLARRPPDRSAAFWREFLAGVEGPTPLPMLAPAHSGPAEPLAQTLTLDEGETARLTATARQLGVTLNTLLQGAWALTLAARSGRDDVVFGVTSAGRPPELEGADTILGVFINTLPLRVRTDAARPAGTFLRGIQADNAAMREHEQAALADIQAAIQAATGGGPLFDTLMVFQNLPMLDGRRRRLDLGPDGVLELRQRRNVERTHYGLVVEVFPGDRLGIVIDADARRIAPDALARLADGLRAALLALTGGANTPVALLARMGEAELRAQRDWGRNPAPYALSPGWVERVAARVAAHPERVAARCDGAVLTYGDLWKRSDRLARGLVACGLRPDGAVGLLVPRGLDLLCLMVAALRAGGGWIPLDPGHPPARWSQVMEQAGQPLLVRDPAVACPLPALTPADLLARAEEGVAIDRPARGDQLAYALFTSGSTGTPKGAMVSRDGMLNNMLAKVAPLGLGEADVIAQTAPACFDISVWQTLTAPLLGACVEIVPDAVTRDPDALLDRLDRAAVTLFEPVPSLMRALVDGRRHPLPALRWVLPTGEALGAADAAAWFAAYPGIPLMNAYGPAECADDVAFHPLREAPPPGAAVPIGRPTAGAELRVIDGGLNRAPTGTTGEIAVGGVGVGRGYLGDPRRTAAAFIPDPEGPPGARLYRTGDLGRWSADGLLEWAGRGDFQIKLRGFRIEAGEVEAVLERHPAVSRAVVQVHDEHLTAWWRPAEPAPDLAAPDLVSNLAAHAAALLPPYMVPTRWARVTDWPLNANGKLDRKALPAPSAAAGEDAALEPPATPTEQRLAALWRELLPAATVGRDSDFFAIGAHSLIAARLVARLRREGWDGVPLSAVFEAPTLRRLAALLDGRPGPATADGLPPLRPVDRRAEMPLSPAQQRLWLVDRLAGGDAAYAMAGVLDLTGDLDPVALETALNAVVARHEVLRTRYPEDDDGDPVARIAPALSVTVPVEDLSGLPPEERDACALALEEEEARTPFDLAAGPLLRARILTLAPGRHRLLFALHHMIADGWSVGVLAGDLANAYRAATRGRAPDWAPLPVQYADYAVWQRALLSGERLAADIDFWRRTLAGTATALPLPTDRPRPAVARGEGAVLRFDVPPALLAGVEGWARGRGATPFMALLAAYQAMLHAETGADDLLVGTDTAGRPARELEGLIGFFVNVVPLRSTIEDGLSFDALLDRARRTILDAFDHDRLPFDRIVEAVGVPRDRGRNPLVQTLLVLQNVPGGGLELPRLSVSQRPAGTRHSKFDMALFLEPQSGPGGAGLGAEWVFATALFDPATIERFHRGWIALLERAVADPAQPIAPSGQETRPMPDTQTTPARSAGDKLSRLGGLTAPPPRSAPREAVRRSFLTPGAEFPIVLEPAAADLDPAGWAGENRALIDDLLLRHGAILFRGFALPTPQAFEGFAEAMEPTGLFGSYGDLPKKEGGRNTYRSTPYPERQMILYHNESSHLDRWPRKQWFFAEQVAPVGGCTPIVDCREMLRRLPADLVADLERRGLLYVRTFTPGLDVGWEDFFKTDDRAAVEARCAEGGIECRWLDEDTPQTRTRCPAVIRHPISGERSFFNQVQLHHPACLEPELRANLLDIVGIDLFPRNVLFGDGAPIPDDVMELIGRTYEECALRFQWLPGDVVMVDNMLTAHARDPYEGPRRVVVAMGAMVDRRTVAPTAAEMA